MPGLVLPPKSCLALPPKPVQPAQQPPQQQQQLATRPAVPVAAAATAAPSEAITPARPAAPVVAQQVATRPVTRAGKAWKPAISVVKMKMPGADSGHGSAATMASQPYVAGQPTPWSIDMGPSALASGSAGFTATGPIDPRVAAFQQPGETWPSQQGHTALYAQAEPSTVQPATLMGPAGNAMLGQMGEAYPGLLYQEPSLFGEYLPLPPAVTRAPVDAQVQLPEPGIMCKKRKIGEVLGGGPLDQPTPPRETRGPREYGWLPSSDAGVKAQLIPVGTRGPAIATTVNEDVETGSQEESLMQAAVESALEMAKALPLQRDEPPARGEIRASPEHQTGEGVDSVAAASSPPAEMSGDSSGEPLDLYKFEFGSDSEHEEGHDDFPASPQNETGEQADSAYEAATPRQKESEGDSGEEDESASLFGDDEIEDDDADLEGTFEAALDDS